MNEPIISPWLIYWAGRIELIQVVCCVVGLVVTAFAVAKKPFDGKAEIEINGFKLIFDGTGNSWFMKNYGGKEK